MKKRMISFFLTLVIFFSMSISAFASDDSSVPPITMEDINSDETKVIYTSEESVFYPDPSEAMPLTYGTYPIYTRVIIRQSSSNGIIECDSAIGTYASIAAIALSFFGGVPAMTVSTILSVVGLVAGTNTYTQAKTFKSYVSYQKQGEARWADESYYTPWVFSGKRDYYKHVLGATRNSSGLWTTKSKDYLDSPQKTDIGFKYNNSDSWFREEARQRCLTQMILDDLPW